MNNILFYSHIYANFKDYFENFQKYLKIIHKTFDNKRQGGYNDGIN